ncbi:MAG: DoxX family protein [Brumimicrobium sp.]
MKKYIKSWYNTKDLGLLIFRIVIGFYIFYGHGFGKLQRLFSGQEIKFADPIGLGEELSFYLVTMTEGVLFIFVILGLLTRFALIPFIITMLVATLSHLDEGLKGMEYSMIYLASFMMLFLTGPGKYSIDAMLKGK